MSALSHRITVGEVTLHASVEGVGPPVVLLHGFTGCIASMAGVAADLVRDHRVVCIDLVGHGESDAPREISHYSMESCVAQVAGVVEALDAAPAHFIGYSMGGRVALALCAWRPDLTASALLVGARPGIGDTTMRAVRARDDCALADRIEREGLASFVDHWMELPMFASQRRLGAPALAAARAQRIANQPHGLAQSLRGMGAGAQPSLCDELGDIVSPVCLVAGDEDLRFCSIAEDLAAKLPRARVAVVPSSGHAAHLENPGEFLRIARSHLADARRPTLTPTAAGVDSAAIREENSSP